MSRECIFLSSLSHHNKDLEWRTLEPPQRVTILRSWIDRVIALRSRTDRVIALRQVSVTALFSLEDSRRIHPRRREESGGAHQHVPGAGEGGEKAYTHRRERVRELLAPPFICFLPPGPALCKLGSGRRAVLPEVLTLVLRPFFDLPLFYFCGLFPSLSFSHHTWDSFSLF